MRRRGAQRVALASFPRSGNTWIRAILETVTGQQTGSIYEDRIMRRDSEGVVIKTHQLDAYKYTRAIHVVRNPFDAIESYYRWKTDISGKEISWDKHVAAETQNWKKHTQYWSSRNVPTYQVRYEDLLSNTEEKATEILSWLGYSNFSTLELRNSLQQVSFIKLKEGNSRIGDSFFKNGAAGMGHAAFSHEQINTVNHSLGSLLKKLKY